MKNTVYLNSNKIINADSLCYIKTLPDNCIDLIATDPPYFRVKSCKWDNQWESESAYLVWLDELLAEFWRVLKPSGSLYMFCGSRLAADTEILVRGRFNVLNHIIWAKPSGPWRRMHKEDLRAYFPATERIIFADHYAGPFTPKGSTYADKCNTLKQSVFKPLIDYFRLARASLGVSAKAINEATGRQMSSHWFSESQWQLPNAEQYAVLQTLFSRIAAEKHQQGILSKPHHDLVEEYQALNRQYSELSLEYESLRRPFAVTADVPYTDVWTFPSVAFYPGKHPCEKPADLMEHIIRSSSRPGDVVADFFLGSGATLKAALKLGRVGIGVEVEEERFNQTVEEIKALLT
ncbi:DNA-methyltransferase [Yersinia enterocolitica]|uniref:DNA-methyltransferase n=1 Tax=Yersinia enterocolitica TaxID=630 RepID=UPI002AC78D3E|nr:site-specific DNA-methyltransferase [Yersinia enterocolitica]HDL6679907.1 site-specific DNA-methyltransferase [Yersinia enterocolitica]HDL6695823.1 site-specific DNA-methyltransferase [Yersinia enterocolitica]HDL7233054.1 site-specific DNA-methyltransferase [Yersinia enterocolitica]HDL8229479.1 site-specific DNA-methyltransferase [Yersinia enterocolitica]